MPTDRDAQIAAWRRRMGGWSAGLDFAVTAVVCVLLGLGLDALVGSGPLFLLVGLVVGVVGGFVAFVRTGLRLSKAVPRRPLRRPGHSRGDAPAAPSAGPSSGRPADLADPADRGQPRGSDQA